ncbi:MAG: Arc family DNA binding domain-containing protein [Verrucomicrobia bacterium]|nr:Arc family DNA binding domain-containing protein [Verrucomicrobiota bacterium]
MGRRKSFLLRIDEELLNELRAWAGDELRSLNGQIEYLLRQAVLRRKKARAAKDPESASAAEEGREET